MNAILATTPLMSDGYMTYATAPAAAAASAALK
jgi:hypothetical protein